MAEPQEQKEYQVKIVRHGYGYVRVRARDKNEAKRAAESMTNKRLLQYYKHEFEFVEVGEVFEPPTIND